jgi:hypothetical protein
MKVLPPVRISRDNYLALEGMARDVLGTCRRVADDGTPVYFPDGSGHYAALWTRDFCYMVEGAGHLLPAAEMLAGIDYLLAAQSPEGVIPDRVQADGTPVYLAGPPDDPCGQGPPADNAPFMAKLICAYARVTRDYASAETRLEHLDAAMAGVPRSADGLVAIDRNTPRPGYGFTDCIAKTGKELFASLLFWEACTQMAETLRVWEQHDAAHGWYERAERIGHRLQEFWDDSHGMFRAASEDCRQIDIWGSAYAAVIRVATKSQADRIADWLLQNLGEISLEGYIRHLPAGRNWQRLLRDVPPGTYQNGGFWAVPTGWVARTVALVDDEAARKLVETLIARFQQDGACEWISREQQVLPGYGASVACLLGSVQRSKA